MFHSVGTGSVRYFDAERSADGLYLWDASRDTLDVESVPFLVAASISYFTVPEPRIAFIACAGIPTFFLGRRWL